MDAPARELKRHITQSIILLFAVMAITGTPFCANAFAEMSTAAGQTIEPEMSSTKADVMKYGLVAAALAFGLGAVGAGIAIAHVGAAAIGAVAEKPQIAGQALIFVALAEGLVIFGFITALMILGKV
ncbi:MAG: ATP synthase subunit C [Sedimentisphaerales bacterium]|jgi:V/A-type H+-transporting ATPase subunit K